MKPSRGRHELRRILDHARVLRPDPIRARRSGQRSHALPARSTAPPPRRRGAAPASRRGSTCTRSSGPSSNKAAIGEPASARTARPRARAAPRGRRERRALRQGAQVGRRLEAVACVSPRADAEAWRWPRSAARIARPSSLRDRARRRDEARRRPHRGDDHGPEYDSKGDLHQLLPPRPSAPVARSPTPTTRSSRSSDRPSQTPAGQRNGRFQRNLGRGKGPARTFLRRGRAEWQRPRRPEPSQARITPRSTGRPPSGHRSFGSWPQEDRSYTGHDLPGLVLRLRDPGGLRARLHGQEFLTDGLTVGYVLALSQFAMTWILGAWYLRSGRPRVRPARRARRAGRPAPP